MDETTYDVIVIGAGLAGLAAAQAATRAGAQVLVLDGQSPGGRARTDDHDGFLFNRGPHALYLGGPAQRVLESFGVDIAGGTPTGNSFGSLGGVVAPLPAGVRTLLTTPLLGVRGKLAIGSLMGRIGRIATEPLSSLTVRQWLDRLRLPADAESLVLALVRVATYANAPDELSASVAVGQLQLALGPGVRYLHGGWAAMVRQLERGLLIERHAAATVEASDDTRAVTVWLAGDQGARRAATVVVANGSPQAAATVLGRQPFDVGPPIEAACLDLGLTAPAEPGFLLGLDQPLYLSNHCPPARLAPAGKHVVHVARYLAAGDALDPSTQRAELEQHAALAGIDTSNVTLTSRYLHRMTVSSAMPVAAAGGLVGRPTITSTGNRRVLLAGDWVGNEGHLADASLASGARAGAMAAERV